MLSTWVFLVALLTVVNSHPLTISLQKSPNVDSKVKIVNCPDGKTACPDGQTCCKVDQKGDYGCCPSPKATCCMDMKHCCPEGYTCDPVTNFCTKSEHTHPLLQLAVMHRNVMVELPAQPSIVNCPDGKTACPDGQTCCKVDQKGDYGCCPSPKATCCRDMKHCCPEGYTCDPVTNFCTKSEHTHPLLQLAVMHRNVMVELPAQPSIVNCPDGQTGCPDGQTCCKVDQKGDYGCCPRPKATCCKDMKHCCPEGYTCDLVTNSCTKSEHTHPLLQLAVMHGNMVELPAQPSNVVCPGGESECPGGYTCCQNTFNKYSCCPLPEAVCCYDKLHCCPNGYTCDTGAGKCKKSNHIHPLLGLVVMHEMVGELSSQFSNINCGRGDVQCPDGYTCCESEDDGKYNCCPLSNAVCCADKEHCCPEGYKCHLTSGVCTKDNIHPMVALIVDRTNDINIKVCPGGKVGCPDTETCCKRTDGTYGCCDGINSVCCSDKLHCCSEGTTCNLEKGTCQSGDQAHPMLLLVGQTHKIKLDKVVCPNYTDKCPDGNTCCLMAGGEYGCCPRTKATCCSDKKHCCPEGYFCDDASQICIRDNSHPLLELI